MPELIEQEYPPADDLWAVNTLKLPQELQQRMKVAARRQMLSVAAWTRQAILHELERKNGHAT